jgi:hypothetical protein
MPEPAGNVSEQGTGLLKPLRHVPAMIMAATYLLLQMSAAHSPKTAEALEGAAAACSLLVVPKTRQLQPKAADVITSSVSAPAKSCRLVKVQLLETRHLQPAAAEYILSTAGAPARSC